MFSTQRKIGPGLFWYFMASTSTGLGLATLLFVITDPPSNTEAIAPVTRSSAQSEQVNAATFEVPEIWPPLFGDYIPIIDPQQFVPDIFTSPPDEMEQLPEEVQPETYELPLYTLRGLVVTEDGGWAMVEGDEGVELLQVGDTLPYGETLVSILDDGIEIDAFGDVIFLGFEDFESGQGGAFDDGDYREDYRDEPGYEPNYGDEPVFQGSYDAGYVGR